MTGLRHAVRHPPSDAALPAPGRSVLGYILDFSQEMHIFGESTILMALIVLMTEESVLHQIIRNIPKAIFIFLLCIFSACGKDDIDRYVYIPNLCSRNLNGIIVILTDESSRSDKTADIYDYFLNEHIRFSDEQSYSQDGLAVRLIRFDAPLPDMRLMVKTGPYSSSGTTVVRFSIGDSSADMVCKFESSWAPSDPEFGPLYGANSIRITHVQFGESGMDCNPGGMDSLIKIPLVLDDNGLRMQ